jgi:apolipoprotein D and lipocalin family protein
MNKLVLLILMSSALSCKSQDLQVVDQLDLNKYQGLWYEIARLPNSFEKKLDRVTAHYSIRPDGKIKVLNKGYLIRDPSKYKQATGVAWVSDAKQPAKLKVRFFWPFSGKYWVIALDKDYRYALVGDPSRKYLWVLNRTKTLDENIYQQLMNTAREKGFDTSKIIRVNQNDPVRQ